MKLGAIALGLGLGLAVVVMTAEDTLERRLIIRTDMFSPLPAPKLSTLAAEDRKGLLTANDGVVAWFEPHDSGAIPIRFFLSGYRVDNGPVARFFFDPDASYVSAFRTSENFDFYGWRDGVMAVRGKDGTLWSALSGTAFDGPRKGQTLERIPTILTTWSNWRELEPDSKTYDLVDGKKYAPTPLPHLLSAQARESMGAVDQRLGALAYVLGVNGAAENKAFPLAIVGRRAVINDSIGGEPLTVFINPGTASSAAFRSALEGRHLTFEADQDAAAEHARSPFLDKETGSRWTITGHAVSGPLAGKQLVWVPSIQCRWYGWAKSYPGTKVFGH